MTISKKGSTQFIFLTTCLVFQQSNSMDKKNGENTKPTLLQYAREKCNATGKAIAQYTEGSYSDIRTSYAQLGQMKNNTTANSKKP